MTGETLTCGSYCPSCGWEVTATAAGRFLTLQEWNARHKGQRCHHCNDDLMPQEFASSEAAAMWAIIHPGN